jgi:hypothetical protein
MDFADVGELKKERKKIRTDRQLKRLTWREIFSKQMSKRKREREERKKK